MLTMSIRLGFPFALCHHSGQERPRVTRAILTWPCACIRNQGRGMKQGHTWLVSGKEFSGLRQDQGSQIQGTATTQAMISCQGTHLLTRTAAPLPPATVSPLYLEIATSLTSAKKVLIHSPIYHNKHD